MKKKIYASILTTILLTTPQIGCKQRKNNNFDYTTDDNGKIKISGNIDYGNLTQNYKLIELKIMEKQQLYISKVEYKLDYSLNGLEDYEIYKDINTDKIIYQTNDDAYSNTELLNENSLNEYLIYYDEIKELYSPEDITEIINKIKQDYKFEDDKTKSK